MVITLYNVTQLSFYRVSFLSFYRVFIPLLSCVLKEKRLTIKFIASSHFGVWCLNNLTKTSSKSG